MFCEKGRRKLGMLLTKRISECRRLKLRGGNAKREGAHGLRRKHDRCKGGKNRALLNVMRFQRGGGELGKSSQRGGTATTICLRVILLQKERLFMLGGGGRHEGKI